MDNGRYEIERTAKKEVALMDENDFAIIAFKTTNYFYAYVQATYGDLPNVAPLCKVMWNAYQAQKDSHVLEKLKWKT